MDDKYAQNVIILCHKCKKEIWQWTNPETTLEEMKDAICSDCLIENIKLNNPEI